MSRDIIRKALENYLDIVAIDDSFEAAEALRLFDEQAAKADSAAQVPFADEQLDNLRQAESGKLNFVTLLEFRTIARAVEAAHGIRGPKP